MWTTLIEVEELAAAIDDCVVVDARHDLMNPQAGIAAWRAGHIPGAFFLGQDAELSGIRTGINGRHPLPERAALAASFAAIGLRRGQQLVAYDAHGGMFASRVWWLARWLGHSAVAVLDGGIDAWTRARYPLSTQASVARPGDFTADCALTAEVDTAQVLACLGNGQRLLVDARAPERYRGEVEPLDPAAGHIPGAINRPFQANLRPDGRFKPAPVLRAEFDALLAGRDPASVVHQCGSGVSACHNLLAMATAGLPGSALYPGSWSAWCADPSRPVATGEQP